MTFDSFKRLKLTPGQQLESQDLMDNSDFLESKISDQLLRSSANDGIDDLFKTPEMSLGMQDLYAYALTVSGGQPSLLGVHGFNSVAISAGTLFQKIGTETGSTPSVLSYEFSGNDFVVFADGDGVHPRVDIIQMKLSIVDDDIQSRAFLQSGTKSSIDCASITTHINSVVQARLTGSQGNNISLSFVADGSGSGSITVSGNTVTFHFQSGTTTVANFESLISGSTQSLVNIKTIGTPTNVFNSATDSAIPTLLSGGIDSVIVPFSLATKRRVSCVLSIKQGIPATSPQYPLPDAGNVVIAGMLINTGWNGASTGWLTTDQTGATAVLHDQRIPIRVSENRLLPSDLNYSSSLWALSTTRDFLIASSGADNGSGANAVYRGPTGRLLFISAVSINSTIGPITGGLIFNLVEYRMATLGGVNYSLTPGVGSSGIGSLITLNNTNNLSNSGGDGFFNGSMHFTSMAHLPIAGPTITTNAQGMTAPVWTNGTRAAYVSSPRATSSFNTLALSAQPGNVGGFHGQNIAVGPITFWIATGLS